MPPLDFVGLLEEIKRSYESMEDPNYSFVDKAISSRPYAKVVDRLEESFDVEDITDPRDDVSFVYLLGKTDVRWELSLSMIGPYAVFLRKSDAGAIEIVTRETASDEEKAVCSLLEDNDIVILDRTAVRHEEELYGSGKCAPLPGLVLGCKHASLAMAPI